MGTEVGTLTGLAKGKTKTGGEGGIRTRETVSRLHSFQPCSFGHSDTSPCAGVNVTALAEGVKTAASLARRIQRTSRQR